MTTSINTQEAAVYFYENVGITSETNTKEGINYFYENVGVAPGSKEGVSYFSDNVGVTDSKEGISYFYTNVGIGPISAREADEYAYENVGVLTIATREGNAFGAENVGVVGALIDQVLPIPTEYWGVVGSGAKIEPIIDTRLGGNAYGYENVIDLMEDVLTNWNGVDGSSFVTDSFSRTTGDKFFVSIGSADNLSHLQTPPSSLVQTGITWTSVNNVTRAGNTLAVWSGVATTTGSSALTINFAGTQLSVTWSITRVAGTTGIVQSAVAQANPSAGSWLDAPLVALQPSSLVLLSGSTSSTPPTAAARPGYSLFASTQANSPNQKLSVYKGIPGVLSAGIQQPSGWGEDMLVIAVELSV